MDWQEWALKKLQDSLVPIPAELNESIWLTPYLLNMRF